jgi:hypothetical protein
VDKLECSQIACIKPSQQAVKAGISASQQQNSQKLFLHFWQLLQNRAACYSYLSTRAQDASRSGQVVNKYDNNNYKHRYISEFRSLFSSLSLRIFTSLLFGLRNQAAQGV